MKAIYTNHDGTQVEFAAKKNPDGTLNLLRGDVVLVERCAVSDDKKPGHAVIVKDQEPKPPKAPKPSKASNPPNPEDEAAALAAAEAALKEAQEAFASDATNVELGRRVDELRAAWGALQ